MEDISNRTLALFLVAAIIVSLGATIYSLNKLTYFGVTGQAQNVPGKVNLSIQNSISIILTNSVVDFGQGFTNVSCGPIATGGKNFSNLTAGQTYNDDGDCWTGDTTPTSFVVENNGNVNVSLAVKGPQPLGFFSLAGVAYSGPYTYNLSAKARDAESNSCASGLVSSYRLFSSNTTFCTNLKYYPDTSDSLALDVNVLIPLDLPAGLYENSTIEFYAVQAS